MTEEKWIDLELGPNAIEWFEGPLPPPESVPFDCVLVLWTKDYVGLAIPWGNSLNPLRWCDGSYHPRWGTDNPEGWWGFVKKGSVVRPDNVKTWAEWGYDEDNKRT